MPVAAGPNWNRLYEMASGQDGHVTTQQAAEAGYSPQLLRKRKVQHDRSRLYNNH